MVVLPYFFAIWVVILIVVLCARHENALSKAHETHQAHLLYIARLSVVAQAKEPQEAALAVQNLEPAPELTPEEILGYELPQEVQGFRTQDGDIVDFLRKPEDATFEEEDRPALIMEDKS